MTVSTSGNAMTEVALALAMAFFSIMILTMVSMSAEPSQNVDKKKGLVMSTVQNNNESSKNAPKIEEGKIIIYWNSRFMDQELNLIQPETFHHEGRKVLVLAPSLPVTEALSARARLSGSDIIVSTLDDPWLKRLGQLDDVGTNGFKN